MTTLFGRFTGQSELEQQDQLIFLTPDEDTGAAAVQPADLLPVRELEGSFGIVKGELRGSTLFEASLVEVIPPILSQVLHRLLEEGALDAQALLPRVEQAIDDLVREPDPPDPGADILCALVVGHRPGARGAFNRDKSVSEFDFNLALAGEIKQKVQRAKVEIVLRGNDPGGYDRLPGQINQLKPHFIVSLHCNAVGDRRVSGTETLYFTSSKKGHRLALTVQRHLVAALGLRNRHTKPRTVTQRGGKLLRHTVAPCVIGEPFFISNDDDLARAGVRRDAFVAAYAAAIDETADSLAIED